MSAGSQARRVALATGTSALACVLALVAWPGRAEAQVVSEAVLPQAGRVLSGTAAISTSDTAMTIRQDSAGAVIDWASFSIAPGQTVAFQQPDRLSATLNLVSGTEASTLAGNLTATGTVFLLNPNGIAITPTGRVDVGAGFVASTLALQAADGSGKLAFKGSGGSAPVSNAGQILVGPRGFAALIGGSVANSGTITVPMGRITLAAGEAATIDPFGDGFLQVAVAEAGSSTGSARSLLSLSGSAAREAWRRIVALPETLAPTRATSAGSSIVIGTVDLSGQLDASSRNGAGGAIELGGDRIVLTGARIDASGTQGGQIALGGGAMGAPILGRSAARTALIDAASTINASGLAGAGGTVTLWGGERMDYRGTITATGHGGNGGSAEVSGLGAYAYAGRTNLLSTGGKTGTLLLDPGTVVICRAGDAGCSGAMGIPAILADGSTTSTDYLQDSVLVDALQSANVSLSASVEIKDSSSTVSVISPASYSLTLSAPKITLSGTYGVTGGIVLDVTDTASGNSVVSGSITGSGGLTKQGVGVLELSGAANTYTGPTVVNSGKLQISGSGKLGKDSAVTVAAGAILDIGGVSQTLGSLAGGGTVTNDAARKATLTIGTNDQSTEFFGSINNSLDQTSFLYLVKVGTGTLTLNPPAATGNGYKGDTTILAGTLRTKQTNAFGLLPTLWVEQGATFDLYGVTQTRNFSWIGGAGTITNTWADSTAILGVGVATEAISSTFSGTLADTGSGPTAGKLGLFKDGTGILKLTGSANTYTGPTTAWKGTLQAGANNAFGTTSTLEISGGGTLDLSGYDVTFAGFSADTRLLLGKITNSGANAPSTLNINNSTDTGYRGVLMDGSAPGATLSLVKSGGGVLTLLGTSTYTGFTRVLAGTLRAGSATAFGNAADMTVESGATLDLFGKAIGLGALAGNGTVNNSSTTGATLTLTVGQGKSANFSGVLANGAGATSTLSLIKAGAGTQILSGTNTYKGTTTLSDGTLRAGSASAFGSDSSMSLAGSSTLDLAGFSVTLGALSGTSTAAQVATTPRL